MNNTLVDLNNHLFAELERLSDEDLRGEELEEELKRAKAISDVSANIIANGALAFKVTQFKSEMGLDDKAHVPVFLEDKQKSGDGK